MEKRGHILILKASYAAADTRHIEEFILMLSSIYDKFIYIWLDYIHSPMHGRNGIALALHSDSLPPNSTEESHCSSRSSASMKPI